MDFNSIWLTAFSDLFNRRAFTAHLLQRSFRHPIGWVELVLVLALTVLAYQLAKRWAEWRRVRTIRFALLRHVVKRLIFPVLMLLLGVVAQVAWEILGGDAVWLRLMVLAANWMIAIRLLMGLLHSALPQTSISDFLERSVSTVLWGCFVLWLSDIDDLIINWLKLLQFSVGSTKLSLYTILTGLIWVGIVMVGMMWLARWINAQLMASTRLDINLRIVLTKVVKTVLIILSVLIALPLVGIDLTVLSVFGGALGVGLGFGLQKIASNYVSGFIILADHSIRPGDRLTVNGFTGYVTELTARFVVLKSEAGAEALIPNETFVTSTVINESYTGKALYQSLNVQVAYSTDLTLALRIMQEAAAEQPRVGKDPAPAAFLTNFGDNGIDLRVSFWVNDPENGFAGLFSAILLTIWRRFNEEKIEFPFPQREVRILNDTDTPPPSDLALLKAKIKSQSDTQSHEPSGSND